MTAMDLKLVILLYIGIWAGLNKCPPWKPNFWLLAVPVTVMLYLVD
jgi:hypothetical protein